MKRKKVAHTSFIISSPPFCSPRVAHRRFAEAIKYYNMALGLQPKNFSINSALGFTYHLMGDLDTGINYYHKVCALLSFFSFLLEVRRDERQRD